MIPPSPTSSLALAFVAFRIAVVVVGALVCLALHRRPRPGLALGFIVILNLATWYAYTAPLGRVYGLEEHTDVSFNIGAASCAAAGNTPLDHVQVGFASLEPIWTAAVALASGYRPERVLDVWRLLPAFAIVVVALGLYFGLRRDGSGDDAWERVLLVFAVFELSSISMSQRAPLPALWAGNFLMKPNHVAAWGLLGVATGMRARGTRPWTLGLVLGVMAWVFLLDWAYLLLGFAAAVVLSPRDRRDVRGLLVAGAVSAVVALPYVLHLARDYDPSAAGGTPEQIWGLSPMAVILAQPHWGTIDLGPLLVGAIAGAVVLVRRGTAWDRQLVGLFAASWVLWLAGCLAILVNLAPETDELHYFHRLALALPAGAALAALGRWIEGARGWAAGRAHALVMLAALPLTFSATYDPISMDRYFTRCLPPLRPKVVEYTDWVRENTPKDAVFVAGFDAATWIPVLAGRRIVLAGESRPPADWSERKTVERTLLTSGDPVAIRAAAARYGVTHIAIDPVMEREYGEEALRGLGRLSVYEPVFVNTAIRILALRRE